MAPVLVCDTNLAQAFVPLQALANQVCEKVESKVRTTYNEVADELVSEFGNVEGTGMLPHPLFVSYMVCGIDLSRSAYTTSWA